MAFPHLDGEHHAHKPCSQQRHAQRLGPHKLQLVLGVAPVDLTCAMSEHRHSKLSVCLVILVTQLCSHHVTGQPAC
jgi:hypothetical protein